jgi:hypothetical protein
MLIRYLTLTGSAVLAIATSAVAQDTAKLSGPVHTHIGRIELQDGYPSNSSVERRFMTRSTFSARPKPIFGQHLLSRWRRYAGPINVTGALTTTTLELSMDTRRPSSKH